MRNRRSYFGIFLIAVLMTSCGNANFAGGGSSKKNDDAPGSTTGGNPGGSPTGNTTGTPGNPTGGTTSGNTTGSSPTPVPPTTAPSGPTNQISQPNGNTIIFGNDRVFHIGDGQFSATSCKDQIQSLALTGNAYFFQFEVVNDNTQVSVQGTGLCGIDYSTNTYELYLGTNRVQGQYIARSATTVAGAQAPLAKGVYTVVIASGLGSESGESKTDKDDFIVGKITIQASQAVKPVRYGAFSR